MDLKCNAKNHKTPMTYMGPLSLFIFLFFFTDTVIAFAFAVKQLRDQVTQCHHWYKLIDAKEQLA